MRLFTTLRDRVRVLLVPKGAETTITPSGTEFYGHHVVPEGPGLRELRSVMAVLPPLDIVHGPWVAGGAARRMLEGKSLSGGDLDLFFRSEKSWRQFRDALQAYELVHKSARATMYLVNGIQVQIIRRRFYDDLQDVFKDFDFSVCQVATDGRTMAHTEQARRDIEDRVLRFAPQGTAAKVTLAARMIKYINHGFLPEPGMFGDVIKKSLDTTSPYEIFGDEERPMLYGDDDVDNDVKTADISGELMREVALKMGLETCDA